jgi:ribosomal protein S27E
MTPLPRAFYYATGRTGMLWTFNVAWWCRYQDNLKRWHSSTRLHAIMKYCTRQHSWKSKSSGTVRYAVSVTSPKKCKEPEDGRSNFWRNVCDCTNRQVVIWEHWNFQEHPCESCSVAQLITTPLLLMGKWKCINKHCDEGSASHSGCKLLGKHSDTQRSEGGVGSRFGLRAADGLCST